MPMSPKTICGYCGKASRGRCDCRPPVKAWANKRRGSARQRGYDRQWQAFRAAFMQGQTEGRSNALCWDCLAVGRVTPAAELHHVARIADAPHRRLDPTNVRPLCRPCHRTRTGKGE